MPDDTGVETTTRPVETGVELITLPLESEQDEPLQVDTFEVDGTTTLLTTTLV